MTLIETLRGPRIFNFVIFDWAITIAGAAVIARATRVSFFIVLIVLLIFINRIAPIIQCKDHD